MRVTSGSYGKTPRTGTIRDAAPCGSWFAHSPAKHFACGHAAGVVPVCDGAGCGAGRESVRAHGVEDPRGLYKRTDHLYSADAGRLSLAGYGIRLASLRWCAERPLAVAARSAATVQLHFDAARLARRHSLDWHR